MPFSIISGIANIGGGIFGALGAGNAANAANAGDRAGIGTLQNQYDETKQNLNPWIQGGQNGLAALLQSLGLGPGGSGATNPMLQLLGIGPNGQSSGPNMAMFQQSPGYQFQLQQGEDAVTNAASRTGGLGGNALKALNSYGQGVANQDFGQYFNQLSGAYGNLTNNLANLSNSGQQAATNLGQFGQNTAGAVAGLQSQIGANNAAGAMGTTNALTGMLGGLADAASGFNPSWFGSGFQASPSGTYGGQQAFTGPTNTGLPLQYNW